MKKNNIIINESKNYLIKEENDFNLTILDNVNCQIMLQTKASFCLDIKNNVRAIIKKLSLNYKGDSSIIITGSNSFLSYIHHNINKEDSRFSLFLEDQKENNKISIKINSLNYGKEAIVLKSKSDKAKYSNIEETCNLINLKDGFGQVEPILEATSNLINLNHAMYEGTFKKSDIYYLNSKGLDQKKSIKLLSKGFILENFEEEEQFFEENYE